MRKLGGFLKKWLKVLELEKYKVQCSVSRPRKHKWLQRDDTAMIDISLGEKKLEIFLNPKDHKVWNESLIVHELTHVLLYRLWEFVDLLIRKGFRGKKAQAALRAQYESLEEESVDRLVRILLKLKKPKHKRAAKRIRTLEGGLGKRRRCA